MLYIPLLQAMNAAIPSYMALAADATIAGMLSILGAVSNVIIIQNAEKRAGVTLSFVEFVRMGVPVTAVCSVVYLLFLI